MLTVRSVDILLWTQHVRFKLVVCISHNKLRYFLFVFFEMELPEEIMKLSLHNPCFSIFFIGKTIFGKKPHAGRWERCSGPIACVHTVEEQNIFFIGTFFILQTGSYLGMVVSGDHFWNRRHLSRIDTCRRDLNSR